MDLGKFDRLWRAFLVPALLFTSYRLITASAAYFANGFSWITFVACLGIFFTNCFAGRFFREAFTGRNFDPCGRRRQDR
jgi:hypothetical protein